MLASIERNEPILRTKITGPGQKATLSAVIQDGMRAVTVRVNDVEGVAGFVLPGDHVDVLLTRQSERTTGMNDVVIQNTRVLAVDQLADDAADRPTVARAVTLEVDTVGGAEDRARGLARQSFADAAPRRRAAHGRDAAHHHQRSGADRGGPARAGGEALHQGLGDARREPAGIQRTGGRNGMARRRRGTGGGRAAENRRVKNLGKGLDMGKQQDRGAGVRERAACVGSAARRAAHRRSSRSRSWPAVAPAAQAREIELTAGRTSATVRISIGKSESVRSEGGFSEVIVSDPEIADAIPLTDRSLSILGKKIGTARVSVYGEGKKLVGVFDVEVSYDTTRLGSELAQRFPHARFRVSSVNGRIMLGGNAPDAVTVDKAMTIAKQFGADVINSVKVNSPQQVMLEVRFVEASRSAGRELGVNWQVVQQNLLDGGAGVGAGGRNRRADLRHRAVRRRGRPHARQRRAGRYAAAGAGGARRGAPPRRAEPGGALGRHRELPRRRRVPDPGRVEPRRRSRSSSRNSASASPSRRPCSATA